jgi:hypothetical protein
MAEKTKPPKANSGEILLNSAGEDSCRRSDTRKLKIKKNKQNFNRTHLPKQITQDDKRSPTKRN